MNNTANDASDDCHDNVVTFECAPGTSRYDFGARLDMYLAAPDQFVPLSQVELQEIREVAAELNASLEAQLRAEREDEEQRDEDRRRMNCKCSCQGFYCDCRWCDGMNEYIAFLCPTCEYHDQLESVMF